jgi:SAM-dependent methyltransferase
LVQRHPRFFANPSYEHELRLRVDEDLAHPIGDVLEIGGIDRPFLSKGNGYCYVGLDVEDKPQCHEVYDRFIVQSIEEPVAGQYGVILSIYVLEHVRNNVAGIQNIFDALRPGGSTHHYVPGKGHPYALGLRLVGHKWQQRLIGNLWPDSVAGGYKTHFHCCTARDMEDLFCEIGFEDVRVRPFYRVSEYFAIFVPAFLAVAAFENIGKRFGWSYFASGFVISGRKPTGD